MATATSSVGRLDNIIKELERLHTDAQVIFDAHIDFVRCRAPSVPFGVLKFREIAGPAGNTMDYVAALKIVRKKITGGEGRAGICRQRRSGIAR
jgi:hypothetical protein